MNDESLGKPLTAREQQVVNLVVDGLSNLEIGERLRISPRTVQTHIRAAMHKTGAANRVQLAVAAVRQELLVVEPGRSTTVAESTEVSQSADRQ